MIVFMILEANHIFIAYAAALKIKFLRLNKNAVIICLRLVSFSIDLPRLFYTRFLCKLALFSSLIFSILPRKISSQQTFSVGDEHITSRYEYHFSMLSSLPPFPLLLFSLSLFLFPDNQSCSCSFEADWKVNEPLPPFLLIYLVYFQTKLRLVVLE
jgi:hypothetical protein